MTREDHPRSRGVYAVVRMLAIEDRMDHPRSRGVYFNFTADRQYSGGSSPLARGLHRWCPSIIIKGGIIPARAGFTRCGGTRVVKPKDHPRSRGVYATV